MQHKLYKFRDNMRFSLILNYFVIIILSLYYIAILCLQNISFLPHSKILVFHYAAPVTEKLSKCFDMDVDGPTLNQNPLKLYPFPLPTSLWE